VLCIHIKSYIISKQTLELKTLKYHSKLDFGMRVRSILILHKEDASYKLLGINNTRKNKVQLVCEIALQEIPERFNSHETKSL
jgi:hypothetical protein